MQSKAKLVVVLGTGGTIAGRAATPSEHLVYQSAQLGVAELVASSPGAEGVEVESEQVAQLDSKDMDFATWRSLALRVAHHVARTEVAGVVITHGTDTLEETAYFLSRVLALDKPVVLTAAMRPASSLEADGPRNLADAITFAARSGERGLFAVVAGQVHAAREVRKVHPQRLDAFSSGEQGPLARIVDGSIRVLRSADAGPAAVPVAVLPAEGQAWPWVEIVTSMAGADGRVADLLASAGVDGIVVAATGNGTVHERLARALAAAKAGGVAVLRSTRCVDGAVVGGDGATLASAGDLSPVKARIELILRLLVERCEAERARG